MMAKTTWHNGRDSISRRGSDMNKFTRDLIRVVRRHANKAGDGHAGWAAIADYWENEGIEDVLVHHNANTPALAIAAMQRAADEILVNSARV